MKEMMILLLFSWSTLIDAQCPTNLITGSNNNCNGNSNCTDVQAITANGDTVTVSCSSASGINCSSHLNSGYTSFVYNGCVYNSGGELTSLPVRLTKFSAFNLGASNMISWETASELNNDHYTLEKSVNGKHWEILFFVSGGGTSSSRLTYSVVDNNPATITYYRLTQFDIDGESEVLGVVSVKKEEKKVDKIFNLLGQEVNEDAPGVKIILYNDGTYKKVYGK